MLLDRRAFVTGRFRRSAGFFFADAGNRMLVARKARRAACVLGMGGGSVAGPRRLTGVDKWALYGHKEPSDDVFLTCR